jgi:hypothetical protein
VGFVPENYIRVWNPVDDAGDSDANEVNVDDDTSGIASMHMPVDGNGCVDYPTGSIGTVSFFARLRMRFYACRKSRVNCP